MYRTINIFLHNEVYGEEQKKLINDFKKNIKKHDRIWRSLKRDITKQNIFLKMINIL